MSLATPVLRAAIRATNALGRRWPHVTRALLPFDENALLDAACRATGLQDFGGEDFRPALRILLDGYEREARLSLVGRLGVRNDTLALLVNRLRVTADRTRHPEIAAQRIVRPIFIVGLPRTGSTLLFHLLAQDPANRVPRTWEVMFPSPPGQWPGDDASDPRIDRAAARLHWLDVLSPDFKTSHPLGARFPIECIAIMSHTFLSSRFHTTYRVPTYQAWLERQDVQPAYEFHRRFLQHLQWGAPAARWVLKAPSHLHRLDTLLATYPDARFVQTHREPLTVLASVASHTAALQAAFSDHVDLEEIGQEVTRRWASGVERAMAFRADAGVAGRFVDVHYRELVRDPIGAVRRIYATLGLSFTSATEKHMRRYLEAHPKDRLGAHRYTAGSFGLDSDELQRRFKAYCDRFAMDEEAHRVA
jgi:LPS sulfotransferase NodH